MRISDWSSDVCSSDLVVLAALGPAWLAGGDAVSAFDAETAAVAVQVIARRGGETQQQRARVADDGLEAERLGLGQWIGEAPGGKSGQLQSATRTGARQADHRRGCCGRRQCHGERAGLRRIAHAQVGAALVQNGPASRRERGGPYV